MCRSFILTVLAIFLTSVSIAQIAHDLTVYSEDGESFTLVVNGSPINKEPSTSVTASNINFDYAKIVIKFNDSSIADIERKNLQIAYPGTGAKGPVAAVYAIKEKKGERVLRFVSRSDKKIQNAPVIIINN